MGKTNRQIEDLTPRELEFCHRYCEIGGETYSDKTASAKATGYDKNPSKWGTRLLKRPAIREYCKALWLDNCDTHNICPSRVLSNIEDVRIRAIKKKDFSTALGCDVQHGKFLAMWTENFSFGLQKREQDKLDDKTTAEVQAFARWSIRQGKKKVLPDTEAVFEPQVLPPEIADKAGVVER